MKKGDFLSKYHTDSFGARVSEEGGGSSGWAWGVLGAVAVFVGLFYTMCARNDISHTREIRAEGEAAVDSFHKSYNRGELNGLYKEASEPFKKTHTEKEFVSLMSSRRERWGNVLNTVNDGFLLEVFGRYTPVMDYPDRYDWKNMRIVELWQRTKFERALVVERFSFVRWRWGAGSKGDGFALLSYEPLEFFSREEAEAGAHRSSEGAGGD